MRKSHYTQIGKEMDWHPLEQGVFSDARKIKIAVVGIGREAGASFVAANLAYHLAKHVDGVTYMEAENAQIAKTLEGRRQACYSLGLYRALGFADPFGCDQVLGFGRLPEHDRQSDAFSMRGRRGKFTDYFALEKEGLPTGSRRNLYANVNWAVRRPLGSTVTCAQWRARSHAPLETSALSETCFEPQQHARFHTPRPATSEPCMLAATQGIGRIPGRYMIVDNPRPESLWEADLVICVVDPLPSRLRSGMQQLEALRDNQIRFGRRFSPLLNLPPPVLWLLNKDNPQTGHRELERSLNIKFDFAVPLIPSEIFYKAEYSSVPIFQMVEAAGGRPHPSGCAAACSEFGRLAKRVLKLLD